MVLADLDIQSAWGHGLIVIDPFIVENINNSSYDVRLGRFYWEVDADQLPEDPRFPHQKVYDPYNPQTVLNGWVLKDGNKEGVIFLQPRQTILGHTEEFIGGTGDITTMMKARSSTGRNFIEVCKCFGGETRFLTDKGLMRLDEHVGEKVRVLTNDGFKEAIVGEFGEQSLQEIGLTPSWLMPKGRDHQGPYWRGNKKAARFVRATKDHGWELINGEVTRELKIGDVVKACGYSFEPNSSGYKLGVQHGFIFGDGTRASKNSFMVNFYGRKYDEMRPYFDNIKVWPSRINSASNYKASATVITEFDFKKLPETYTPDYMAGFINGWICADGSVGSRDGDIILQSTDHEALAFVEDACPYAGFVVTGKGEKQNAQTNKGLRSNKIRWITLRSITNRTAWRVTSIKEIEKKEQVYCVTVPQVERFTLAGGIYSFNCAGWGDVGYVNRWTMEITNNSDYVIPLRVGMRIAQIVFIKTLSTPRANYLRQKDSKYSQSVDIEELKERWQPQDMLPRMWKDREFNTK